jgi:hypothetical protein
MMTYTRLNDADLIALMARAELARQETLKRRKRALAAIARKKSMASHGVGYADGADLVRTLEQTEEEKDS